MMISIEEDYNRRAEFKVSIKSEKGVSGKVEIENIEPGYFSILNEDDKIAVIEHSFIPREIWFKISDLCQDISKECFEEKRGAEITKYLSAANETLRYLIEKEFIETFKEKSMFSNKELNKFFKSLESKHFLEQYRKALRETKDEIFQQGYDIDLKHEENERPEYFKVR